MDRQTDGQTDRQKQSLNPASAYARGVITSIVLSTYRATRTT